MNKAFISENARQRERLVALVERLTEKELQFSLEAGWTIAAALAHLAFWDQWSLVRLRRWKKSGVESTAVDMDAMNDTFLPFGLSLEPRTAAKLAISSAEAIDQELEGISDELIQAIENLGGKFRLYRSIHRKMHLDEIEAVLLKKRGTT
jgi:hypothetical protein